MVTGAVSAAPVLAYTGAERQGGTRQEKETRKERLGMPRVGNMGSSLNEKADPDLEPVFRIEVHHQ
jgi:hypothetical protein